MQRALRRFRDCKYRQAEMGTATLARRDPADHLRTVEDRLLRMKGSRLASKSLAQDLRVFVNKN
jgi:hypothetical protein